MPAASSLNHAAAASSSSAAPPNRHRRNQANRRDDVAKLDRAIQLNFKDFTNYECDVLQVDGLTLRDRVKAELEKATAEKGKVSSAVWKSLRTMYSSEQSSLKQLVVSDPNDKVSADLIKALKAASCSNTTARSVGPMLHLLKTVGNMNQREFVGVLRHILSIRPAASPNGLSVIIEVMRMVVRLKLQALVLSLAAAKKSGAQLKDWWMSFAEPASLVVPKASVQAILAHIGEWSGVATHLGAVIASANVGEKMFGFAHQVVQAEKAGKNMREELGKLKTQEINMETIAEAVSKCQGHAKEAGAHMNMAGKRAIKVDYRGVSLELQIQGFEDELWVRVAALVKSMAVDHGVEALAFETVLFDNNRRPRHSIDQDVLGDYALARTAANAVLGAEIADAETCRNALKAKSKRLLTLDKSFITELELANRFCGDLGKDRLAESIMKCFPESDGQKSIATCRVELNSLAGSDLYRFSSKASQGMCDAVIEMLHGLERGTPPAAGFASSHELCRKVVEASKHFVSHEIAAAMGGGKQVLYGDDAMKKKVENAKRHRAGKTLEFGMLQDLHAFEFMLDEDDKKFLSDATQEMLSGVAAPGARSRRPAANDQPASKKKKTANAATDDANVDSLFAA